MHAKFHRPLVVVVRHMVSTNGVYYTRDPLRWRTTRNRIGIRGIGLEERFRQTERQATFGGMEYGGGRLIIIPVRAVTIPRRSVWGLSC